MKIDANKIILFFRDFLNSSWTTISKYNTFQKADQFIEDWMQANWEMMVEACLCTAPNEFLEVYGNGADCNEDSSRVWMPKALPTHRITCRSKQESVVLDELSNESIDPSSKIFNRFVSWNGKHYEDKEPFGFVLIEDLKQEYVVSVKSITFSIVLIKTE